ncbi:uncharacterized protein CDAR_488541 [Caerostris darwini]|uniref:Uncharacterized protein n=1 Tax=Caerostris darwini TaxID=1538125 RepID=A0AAV4WJW8_9ARAC|nr:uncharacterized protein CDAR_488541 [Caerostris darwini]
MNTTQPNIPGHALSSFHPSMLISCDKSVGVFHALRCAVPPSSDFFFYFVMRRRGRSKSKGRRRRGGRPQEDVVEDRPGQDADPIEEAAAVEPQQEIRRAIEVEPPQEIIVGAVEPPQEGGGQPEGGGGNAPEVDWDSEPWLNRIFQVPSKQRNRREFYPWSTSTNSVYRLKLAFVLFNLSTFLYWGSDCERLAILFSCWFSFVVCDHVFRNYPWRQHATTVAWKLFFVIPFSRFFLFAICSMIFWYLVQTCTENYRTEDSYRMAIAIFGWLLWMGTYPDYTGENWGARAIEDDYDQYSRDRPYIVTFNSYLGRTTWVMSKLAVNCFINELFCCIGMVIISHRAFVKSPDLSDRVFPFLFGVAGLNLSGRYLKNLTRVAQRIWEAQVRHYYGILKRELEYIEAHADEYQDETRPRFHMTATQVPLLLQEVEIMQISMLPDEEKRILVELANSGNVLRFRRQLDDYGPYTHRCCIS